MTDPGSRRARISALLVEIRGNLNQTEAAARSGIAQGTISKAENGKYTFRPKAAEQYARALRASPQQRADLVELSQAVADATPVTQTRVTRKNAEAQRRILAVEKQSREIRTWQAEIVPGLLQHWDYTLHILEREPNEEWIAARRERIALIYDPSRMLFELVSEGVLRTVIGSIDVQARQLDHLTELSRLPNVHLAVLPHGRPVPAPMPSFDLYGDRDEPRMATNETIVGTAFLDGRLDLDRHRRVFDRLWAGAATGDDARELIAAARADL